MPQENKKGNGDQSTYLKSLKFDPRWGKGFIGQYLANLRLVLLIVLFIVAFGGVSYLNLPRNLNPEIKIPLVIVSVVLPGAGSGEVESLISVPVEDAVRGLEGVKKVNSTSRESFSITSVEFVNGVDPEKARTDVQSAIDTIPDLPQDAQPPRVQKLDFENQPVWSFDLTSKGDGAGLFNLAKILKKDLEELDSVDRVAISGLEEQEIQLLLKPEVMSSYRVNPQQVLGQIKSSVKSLPAGSARTSDSNFALSIDPTIVSVEDIRNLKMNLNGSVVSLGEIYVVATRSKPNQSSSFIASPEDSSVRAVSFSVFRNPSHPIEEVVKDARERVAEKLQNYDGVFEVFTSIDYGEMIAKQFDELQRDFLITVFLVTLVLFIFLGIRQALVVTISAPLTFFITFIVMSLAGISLSFISVFSLLLALGLLVDDTIVIISAVTAYDRTGKFTPLQTGILVWKDFLIPVLTTTITTVWAFIPLLLAGGIIGEFIKPVPIVVSTTLIASIFTALFIIFPFILFLLKPNMPGRVRILGKALIFFLICLTFYLLLPKENNLILLQILSFLIFLFVLMQVKGYFLKNLLGLVNWPKIKKVYGAKMASSLSTGIISFHRLSFGYKRLIRLILTSPGAIKKAMIMVIGFSIFAYSLFPLGFVKNEFFPKADYEMFFVSVQLPPGTNLDRSNEEALTLLSQLKQIPGVDFVIADVGKGYSSYSGISQSEGNNILFTVHLVEEGKRRSSMEIAQGLRKQFSSYQKGKFTVEEVSGGPPAGADLQIKLFGPDLATLDSFAIQIQEYLTSQKGTVNVDKSLQPGTSKLVFVPDNQKLAEIGMTVDQVGFWLRFYASGLTAEKIKLEGDDQKTEINMRLSSQVQEAQSINRLSIPTANGYLPISSLGKLKLEPNPTSVTREDGKRTISVFASVTQGYSITTLNQQLENYARSLDLPSGYSWQTGGMNEENQKSVNSILQAMALSFVLILITMVVQFSSFRRALIVMLVIPLSIAGVFIIFALTQTPLSFPSLVGVLALFGIVVKNSILVVDKIVANTKVGMEFVESIADGAASRLEPIALTSLTAIIGLIPISLSDPMWRGLGGAIIAGLTFSGTIMLFFIPVVYYLIFQGEAANSRKVGSYENRKTKSQDA